MSQLKHAVIAVCLTMFGASFEIVAGLWPVDTTAVDICAVIGWVAWLSALSHIGSMK